MFRYKFLFASITWTFILFSFTSIWTLRSKLWRCGIEHNLLRREKERARKTSQNTPKEDSAFQRWKSCSRLWCCFQFRVRRENLFHLARDVCLEKLMRQQQNRFIIARETRSLCGKRISSLGESFSYIWHKDSGGMENWAHRERDEFLQQLGLSAENEINSSVHSRKILLM